MARLNCAAHNPISRHGQKLSILSVAEDIAKKKHKRNPFDKRFLDVTLAPFSMTTTASKSSLQTFDPHAKEAVETASVNVHVRAEIIRTMRDTLSKGTTEAVMGLRNSKRTSGRTDNPLASRDDISAASVQHVDFLRNPEIIIDAVRNCPHHCSRENLSFKPVAEDVNGISSTIKKISRNFRALKASESLQIVDVADAVAQIRSVTENLVLADDDFCTEETESVSLLGLPINESSVQQHHGWSQELTGNPISCTGPDEQEDIEDFEMLDQLVHEYLEQKAGNTIQQEDGGPGTARDDQMDRSRESNLFAPSFPSRRRHCNVVSEEVEQARDEMHNGRGESTRDFSDRRDDKCVSKNISLDFSLMSKYLNKPARCGNQSRFVKHLEQLLIPVPSADDFHRPEGPGVVDLQATPEQKTSETNPSNVEAKESVKIVDFAGAEATPPETRRAPDIVGVDTHVQNVKSILATAADLARVDQHHSQEGSENSMWDTFSWASSAAEVHPQLLSGRSKDSEVLKHKAFEWNQRDRDAFGVPENEVGKKSPLEEPRGSPMSAASSAAVDVLPLKRKSSWLESLVSGALQQEHRIQGRLLTMKKLQQSLTEALLSRWKKGHMSVGLLDLQEDVAAFKDDRVSSARLFMVAVAMSHGLNTNQASGRVKMTCQQEGKVADVVIERMPLDKL